MAKADARIGTGEFDAIAADAEFAPAVRQLPQGLVDIDRFAARAEQRDAVGEQIERMFETAVALAGDLETGSQIMRALEMRTQTPHQRDLAAIDVPLPRR